MTTMRKKCYISGAIDSRDAREAAGLSAEDFKEYQKRAFESAAAVLRALGWKPINPFENGVSQNAHWRAHMKVDLAMLLQCDAIYLLKGWELSKGCKLEFDVATTCGMKVYYEEGNRLEDINGNELVKL